MEEIIEKAEVLIEALPYIRSFKGKTVVVKYGGSTMAGEHRTDTVLTDVVFMETVGMRPVVVHGGGKEISQRMQELGVQTQWVNGLRVTDEPAMEVVEETLFGFVNKEIVREILRLGGRVEGVSAKDAGIMRTKRHFAVVDGRPVDIGFVGEVERIDIKPIVDRCDRGIIPVIAPIGLGEDGRSYNVNADTAAGEIAAALKAEKLVFLTDVKGIMRDERLLSTVYVGSVEELVENGTITGGMIPKIRACVKAVKAGVRKTHIIDGRIPHSMLLEIFTDKGVGTEMVM